MSTIITRYHDISVGHRVVGHEGKCQLWHGHNYRIHFSCTADQLDDIGRIIDFSEIKHRLCDFLEVNWDHKFLMWEKDPFLTELQLRPHLEKLGIVLVTFNPTAEHIAQHLLNNIGPKVLKQTGVTLVSCIVEETRKCSATASLNFLER